MEKHQKLCLSCARQKLAGKPEKPCGTCAILNVDPMAQVRANAARPSPMLRYTTAASSFSSLCGGPSSKPARAKRPASGR